MDITYKTNATLKLEDIITVFNDSGIRRPTDESERIQQMFDKANLVISAWDGDQLIGLARSLTDFVYCCYLSDLAVKKRYQHLGIGKTMIFETQRVLGKKSMILLLAAPEAMAYYPKVGMNKAENAFILPREE